MRFRTKVDRWLAAAVATAPIMFVVVAIAEQAVEVWLIGLPAMALVALVVVPCHYTFEEHKLVVRSGIVRWSLPYSKIYRVRRTRNPLSSPAWSLDRLAIHYRKTWIMVSPLDKEEFLTELMRRTSLLQQGEELAVPD